MNRKNMDRGRIGRLLVCLCVTLLLIGSNQGTAHAQIKLVKPSGGGTIPINKAGSYFLASNLSTALTNTPAILVKANNVTINLNGFSIIGPGGSVSATATGIKAASGVSGVTIVNGTITKIHGTGIILGSNSTVSGVQLIGNGADGMDCTSSCLVTSNIVSGNTGTGLSFGDTTSGYQNNILSGNGTNVTGGTSLGQNVCSGSIC